MSRLLRLILLCALVFGPFTAVPAAAQSPAAIDLTHEIFYGPHEFHPSDSGCAYLISAQSLYAGTSGGCDFSIPIILSSDADIIGVTYYFLDNSATNDLVFTISAYDPATNTDLNKSYTDTSGQSPSPAFRALTLDLSGSKIPIDNDYAYTIRVHLPQDLDGSKFRFLGAKIEYSLPLLAVPHTEYLTIRGDSFLPASADYQYTHAGPAISLSTFPTEATQSLGYFAFPLNLPPGATVTEVTTWYVDASPESIRMVLLKNDVTCACGSFDILIDTPTTPYDSNRHDQTAIVENNGYTVDPGVQLILYFKPAVAINQTLHTLRIQYTKPTISPFNSLAISGAQFLPTSYNTSYNTVGSMLHSGDEDGIYRAGFHLREKYAIKTITLYVKDNNPLGQMAFFTYSFNPLNGANRVTPVSGTGDAAASDTIRTISLQPGVLYPLNPADRFYALEVHFNDNNNLEFLGAVIEYYYDRPV